MNPHFTPTYGYIAAEVVGIVTPRVLKGKAMKPEGHRLASGMLVGGAPFW